MQSERAKCVKLKTAVHTAINDKGGYLLPTWAWKINFADVLTVLQLSLGRSCTHDLHPDDDWSIQSKCWRSYFLSLVGKITFHFVYAGADWEATESVSLLVLKPCEQYCERKATTWSCMPFDNWPVITCKLLLDSYCGAISGSMNKMI